MKLNPSDFRKIVIASFLAVPFLSSLISTIHIITFFGLGNMSWMAIILALAFEIGSIASLMTLTVLDKVNKFAVWFIFFVLVIMQMLGNVYYTYDFISTAMLSDPKWIDSFIDLVEMMTMQKLEQRTTKFILSLLIGLPIPVISLAFLKSVSDYLKPEDKIEDSKKEETSNDKQSLEETLEDDEIKSQEDSEDLLNVSEEEIEDNLEYSSKVAFPTEINSQITDAVTQVLSNDDEIYEENEEQVEEVNDSIEDTNVKTQTELDNIEETFINEEVVLEEELKEVLEDTNQIELQEEDDNIYEIEPDESFFDDTTLEEEFDNFQDEEENNKDDQKKSL